MTKLPLFDRQVAIFDSSNIQEISYDFATKKMLVHFSNGADYLYSNVSLAQFATIVGAESVGKTFNSMKPAFLEYERIA